MKNLVLTLMVFLIAIGLAVPMLGGTFASFSDVEISEGNYINTVDLDLKVNGKDDLEIETFFDIAEGEICTTYASSPSPIPLTNEGSVDGPLYLHIKNLVGPDSLSQNVDIEIWYDGDWVTSGSLYDLACQQIELDDDMPANGIIKEVTMELHASVGAPGESLTFDIAFELFGGCCAYAYSDIETSRGNYFGLTSELGGSPGFWSSPGAKRQYEIANMASWFRSIVLSSAWFENTLADGSDDEVYSTMVDILKNTGDGGYGEAVNRFHHQYLATRLNTMTDPARLELGTLHNITNVPTSNGGYIDASDYLGFDIGTLQDIINTIESKASACIFSPPPQQSDILLMKCVCEALDQVWI
jgi:hypothetical protein